MVDVCASLSNGRSPSKGRDQGFLVEVSYYRLRLGVGETAIYPINLSQSYTFGDASTILEGDTIVLQPGWCNLCVLHHLHRQPVGQVHHSVLAIKPKICNLQDPLVVDQEVRGLHITVQDVVIMQIPRTFQ